MLEKLPPIFKNTLSDRYAYMALAIFFVSLLMGQKAFSYFSDSSKSVGDSVSNIQSEYKTYKGRISEDKTNYFSRSYTKTYQKKRFNKSKQRFFNFDPNTLQFKEAMQLGFSKKLFNNLDRYREAGGGFSRKSDLKKLYGMEASFYQKIEPYIELKSNFKHSKFTKNKQNNTYKKGKNFSDSKYPKKDKKGISKAFDEPLVVPTDFEPYPFNPNTISKKELQYFGVNSKAAYNWTQFRASGGEFKKLSDVAKIYDLPANELANIKPYLQFPEASKTDVDSTDLVSNMVTKAPYPFDPNIIDKKELIALGIDEKVASRWLNFRVNNPFYEVADVEKIYNINATTLSRLVPFMQFPENPNLTYEEQQAQNAEAQTAEASMLATEKTDHSIPIIELNTATKEELILLPYIKEGRADLILKHRKALGGFANTNQLLEIWGIDTKAFTAFSPYIRVDDSKVKKINVNTTTAEDLKQHPNIDWQTANAIVKYREQNGHFERVEDLKRIYILKGAPFEKLNAYFRVE